MDMKTYRVVCLKCDGGRTVQIHKSAVGDRVDWLEDKQDGPYTIVSGRPRLDGQWGWECICGNKDLMTSQEARTFSNPVTPTPQEISDVVKNLVPDKPKFKLVEA